MGRSHFTPSSTHDRLMDSTGGALDWIHTNPLEDWFADNGLAFLHPTILVITLCLIAVIGFLLTCFKGGKKTARGNLHLITGITNAGKTALYTRFRTGRFEGSISSLRANEGTFAVQQNSDEDQKFHIVDYPGHLELKEKLLNDFLPRARSVIFVVDAVDFPSQVRDVASYLYMLLMNKAVNRAETPFLIACNKSEMLTAQSPENIRKQLEKELNQLRDTNTSMPGIQGDNNEDEEQDYLGYENQEFEFTHLPFEVEFVSCSVKLPTLDAVVSYLTRE